MYKIEQNGDNRLDMEISGKIDSAEMKAILEEYVTKSQDMKDGLMLYRITDFNVPTIGAIGIEFARLPKLIRSIGHFKKAAVLTDKTWVQKVSEWEGKLIPGLDIKAFNLGDDEKAEAWLSS